MNFEKAQRTYLSYMKASCGEYANDLARSLRALGYGVFFEKKSPRSGEFEKNNYLAINNSEWFLIILDKHIFENWCDEKNWIHLELSYAIEQKKRIIAVKTPGLDITKELNKELDKELFTAFSDIIELDTKNTDNTALMLREIIEKEDEITTEEKVVNRVFSGIYLWRIALFPIIGALMMLGQLFTFHQLYVSKNSVDAMLIFDRFGTTKVFTFNLAFVILAGLLCGILLYITKKVLKLDIIPLFLADVIGTEIICMASRKTVDMIYDLGTARYWTNSMGNAVWLTAEYAVLYTVILTFVLQAALYLYKRARNFV